MSNRPQYIILPTSAMIANFNRQVSAMSVIDIDLNEILSEIVEALSGRFESIDFGLSALLLYYESHGTADGTETEDGRILAEAAQLLACTMNALIDSSGLRDPNGVLYYVFEQLMPGSYDMVISWRY